MQQQSSASVDVNDDVMKINAWTNKSKQKKMMMSQLNILTLPGKKCQPAWSCKGYEDRGKAFSMLTLLITL